MIYIWSNWILKQKLPPVHLVLHIALRWLVEGVELLSLLTVWALYSYFGISHWSEMLWLSFLVPFGAFCAPLESENPAVTHFALIVPLPSGKECQRPVFPEFDSDILPPILLTLQAYLTWQDECYVTHKMNQAWGLIAESLGVVGSVMLISHYKDRVDYITRQRLTIYHFENIFLVKDGRKCLPSVFCKRKEIPQIFNVTSCPL